MQKFRARIGEKNPNWRGGTKAFVCPQCERTFLSYRITSIYCSRKCADTAPAKRQKSKDSHIGQIGELSGNWRGGRTALVQLIRTHKKYKQWRNGVFARDFYACRQCGKRGIRIHADHIESFQSIIIKNKIQTLRQAFRCEELWDLENGRTLCIPCHKKTKTYGRPNQNKTI